jgi:hypothetical protein
MVAAFSCPAQINYDKPFSTLFNKLTEDKFEVKRNVMSKSRKVKQYLSNDMRDELDKRFKDHQNGIGQSYTWDETLAMARRFQQSKLVEEKPAK